MLETSLKDVDACYLKWRRAESVVREKKVSIFTVTRTYLGRDLVSFSFFKDYAALFRKRYEGLTTWGLPKSNIFIFIVTIVKIPLSLVVIEAIKEQKL